MKTNKTLWQRIQDFNFDEANAVIPFSKKLANKQKWSISFSLQAIQEYKKFMYLCCISQNGASPSKIVDEVWHLHLTYTVNYWDIFCDTILQHKIHHYPSNGSLSENTKFKNWEQNTLQLYKREFGETPPINIWSNKMKKPMWYVFQVFCLLIVVSLFFTGCRTNSENFIGIGILLLIMVSIILLGLKSNPSNKNQKTEGGSCGSVSCGSSCGSGCGGCGGGCGGCGS